MISRFRLIIPETIAEWRQLEERLMVSNGSVDKGGLHILKGEFRIAEKLPTGQSFGADRGLKYSVVICGHDSDWESPIFSMYARLRGNPGAAEKAFLSLPKSFPGCTIGISVECKTIYDTRRTLHYASLPGQFAMVLKGGRIADYASLTD